MPVKSARRRAREFILQALYQWQLTQMPVDEICAYFCTNDGFAKADPAFFDRLLPGIVEQVDYLSGQLAPYLGRPYAELSPIERGILLLATYELAVCVDTPHRVVLNEAIELSKSFGGQDSYRFVNSVLHQLLPVLRPA
jgi:N utilization substance protein B